MSKPCVTLGLTPSFGFGDRIGLATAGHVAAMHNAGAGIAPIFPQQSIREMTRTQRTPDAVMADAMNASVNWDGAIGADADHLKTPEDVDITVAAGFTFFTIDPSDHVDQKADDYDEATLRDRFSEAREHAPWYETYLGKAIQLDTGSQIDFDQQAC
ncbi:MAG: tagaturonate epimerase family protein, partial [Verrucomicrobiota bacterium]